MSFEYRIHPNFPELDWLLLNFQINKLSAIYEIEVLAFVMMSTHCHLLLKSYKKSENYFAHHLLKKILPINNISDDFIDQNLLEPITNQSQFLNTYKYIYRNPVEAKLAERCENYRFSTLHSLLGKSELIAKVSDPLSIIQNPLYVLNWLNQSERNYYTIKKNNFLNHST